MLIEHRVDHVDKGFIGGEKTVAASENVAFKPAFERVLAEYLHDAPEDVKLATVGVLRFVLCEPCLL